MHIVVVGAGAAGFFSAINSARCDPKNSYTILEATGKSLTKVLLSGGGRCNVTHHCFDPLELVKKYPRGKKELIGAFSRFQPKDTCAWFLEEGVRLKVEDDGRMFPVTNKSQTIINCLLSAAEKYKIKLCKGWFVKSIKLHRMN